jgi:hypothetical protein
MIECYTDLKVNLDVKEVARVAIGSVCEEKKSYEKISGRNFDFEVGK